MWRQKEKAPRNAMLFWSLTDCSSGFRVIIANKKNLHMAGVGLVWVCYVLGEQPDHLHPLWSHRIVATTLALALVGRVHSVLQCLLRNARYFGRDGRHLATHAQPDRVQLEFQCVPSQRF